MPDNQFMYCHPRSELEQFFSPGTAPEFAIRTRTAASVKKEHRIIPPVMMNAKRSHSDSRAFAPVNMGEAATSTASESPKKARSKPESSQHFGVRFRPDLNKWVAEIRVAEWKTVDKKVWLGTFDTEEGAARAVDAARKLLNCKKKRPDNFPCAALTAYAERIPAALNLNNLHSDSMFKEVTLFVKRKAQEYAAGCCPDKTSTAVSIAADQIPSKYTTSALENFSSSAGTSSPDVSTSWCSVDPCSFDIGSYVQVEVEQSYCDVGGSYQNLDNIDVWELDMDSASHHNELQFPNIFDEAIMDHEMMYNMESQTYIDGDAPALLDWAQQSPFASYNLLMDYSITQVC